MVTRDPALLEGTFEYIEAKIRRDAAGTAFGGDFEWLCKWFLENAPRYRGQFDKVWLWKDWPDRWSTDAGIDIVAQTRTGELWAIQSKADHPDRAIPKREIDSFLSESNRAEFAYRLLMATTDDIGATARRTLHGQEKPVGLVLRGHLLTEEVLWPVQIGRAATRLARWKARPHQAAAIKAVVKELKHHDRGRLIMACGTGKTLTALWIAERLQSSRTLVLVPSLSLMQQNISEWGRQSKRDFDTLVVCSDETVVSRNEDTAIQSTADLGVQVTTDPAEIRHFLGRSRKRPAVVFATYQSSDRIAAAQTSRAQRFDLAICDEAHRLAGHAGGLFATVLDGKKIKARKRLFMTATPRYFKEHVKRRAAELEFELVSMDDEHVFGPEFHVLTFHEAISADPPLLTDYQVVVIGVTDREARQWAGEARLVRTAQRLHTDARTLAAQIGLAKAMKKYDLRKIITFHSSVAKAQRFVDAAQQDSLPGVIPHLSRSSRPTGKLWTKHISGHMPAGQRATLLKGLGNLLNGTRGILSNCACLGEGVDVPVLDGVAFIDPKRSMVDIIQAVGRVIRKAAGKKIGTILIPVFIDETEDADHVLSQSAFEPVWQVLKALRAHDRRLADELDQLRLSLGRRPKSNGRISLPKNIHLDVPHLLLRDFEQAFYVRTVEQTTDRPRLTIEQILAWADTHKERRGEWPKVTSGTIQDATNEDWKAIHQALYRGDRGLPGGSSLAKLLAEFRAVRNPQDLPSLTADQIIEWADEFYSDESKWPTVKSGSVKGSPKETWPAINDSLIRGARGLPGNSSLAKLLAEHRGKRNIQDLPPLTIDQILAWADAHHESTGSWPTQNSGNIGGITGETWIATNAALRLGLRGLPGGSSVAKLLDQFRGKRNEKTLPPLTTELILAWADAHHNFSGDWPTQKSGLVHGTTGETWNAIHAALSNGCRGLSGGSSLAKLLAEHRSVRNKKAPPAVTIEQILAWADSYHKCSGKWPTEKSGPVQGTSGETWGASLTKQHKRLARTAASIHAILTSDPVKLMRVEPPEYWWERVQEDLRLIRLAQDRGWNGVLETQRRQALSSLRQLLKDVTGKISALDQLAPAQHLALSPRHVYEDLLALEQEFEGKVEWKAKSQKLCIETEPIELEGRYLGAFRIELCLKELQDSSPYEIVALDPHPAAKDDSIVHPHVSGGALCEGEGKAPIRNALRSGRLYDFFLLVNNILHTYNRNSLSHHWNRCALIPLTLSMSGVTPGTTTLKWKKGCSVNFDNGRFARQEGILPPAVLNESSATVIGVGAIGRQVALQLAAIGVPRLQIVDHDQVEFTNVTSQGYLWEDAQLQRPKVVATRQAIRHIDPNVEVEIIEDRFRPKQEHHPAVFCCVDSISTRATIWRAMQGDVRFWADGRMMGEVIRVLAVADGVGRELYKDTLFPEAVAQQGSCTSRSTIYAATIAAALMVHQFTRWLRRLPVDFDTSVNLLAGEWAVSL